VRISPNSPVAEYNFGMALLQTRGWAKRLNILTPARAARSAQFRIQYNLGLVLLLHDKPDEAASHFAAALVERPGFAEAHYRLAQGFCPNNTNQRKPFFITARRCASSRNSPKRRPRFGPILFHPSESESRT